MLNGGDDDDDEELCNFLPWQPRQVEATTSELRVRKKAVSSKKRNGRAILEIMRSLCMAMVITDS